MSPDTSARSPIPVLAAAAVLLLLANLVSAVLMQFGMRGMTVADPLAFLGRVAAEYLASLVGVAVLVGGVGVALSIRNTGRALLLVAPVAFVCFLGLSVFHWLPMARSGGLVMALSVPVERTALLVALVLVGRSVRPRRPSASEAVAATPTD